MLRIPAALLATALAFGAPAMAQTTDETAMPDAPILTDLTPADAGMPDPADVHDWVAAYFKGTRGGDAAGWASAFAEGAVVDDPVGTPVKDSPEAIMQMGEDFLGAFAEVGLHESFVHVVGLEAVAKWQGRGTTHEGQSITFEGINHFTFDESGKITQLRGFFAPPGS